MLINVDIICKLYQKYKFGMLYSTRHENMAICTRDTLKYTNVEVACVCDVIKGLFMCLD